MSDPQDLLYTNQFVKSSILSKAELLNNTKNYDLYKDYVDKNTETSTKKYITEDEYESSLINLDRSATQKWPVDKNKNHYPIFDPYINDISTNIYKKSILTRVNIDSQNRDKSLYNNPNNFNISLNRVFNNVTKLYINDLIFSNPNQAVNNGNNNLSWQYASSKFLLANNIDKLIIPVPGAIQISYSSLTNSVYKYTTSNSSSNYIPNIDSYLVYQSNIPPGLYTVDDMEKGIRKTTSSVLHGYPYNYNSNIIEEPYLANPKLIGTPHLFNTNINTTETNVYITNRMEEITIVAMQTFSPYCTDFKNQDIFYNFSSQGSDYVLNTSLVYILLPAYTESTYQYYQNIYNINSSNPFPLVITNLNFEIGNINSNIFNFTVFFDINIYLNNGYTEAQLSSICYYKFIDTITLTNYTPSISSDGTTQITTSSSRNYLRFGLHLSTGMLNGKAYNKAGKELKPAKTDNIIFTSFLNNYFSNYNNTALPISTNTSTGVSLTSYFTSGIFKTFKYFDSYEQVIGRSLLFRWIVDKVNGSYTIYETNTINVKKRSLLRILGFAIANQSLKIFTTIRNEGFNFVQTSAGTNVVNDNITSAVVNYDKVSYSKIQLPLYNYGGTYYFTGGSYIFLKITGNTKSQNINQDQLINAIPTGLLQYDQVYVTKNFLTVGIGEDYTCLPNNDDLNVYQKDYSGLLAKIILNPIIGNSDINNSNIINSNNIYVLYNNVIDNLSDITVTVYNSQLEILGNTYEYSFTLNILEDNNILKETFINTKTNNVSSNGHYI